jgi:hypothetical protein
MAEFTQVRNDVWQDPEFETLPFAGKLLWLNLLTTPFRNTAGMFHYTIGRMAFETSVTLEQAREALDKLVALEWVQYDEETAVVWVCNFLRRQPHGPGVLEKARREVEEGFSHDHPLVQGFWRHYADFYGEGESHVIPTTPPTLPPTPEDTDSDPPSDSPSHPGGSARKHSTAQQGTAQHATGNLARLGALAFTEIPGSESTEAAYTQAVARALDRGMGLQQIEAIIYQLADWWPTRPAKARKRTLAHKTLLQWFIKEQPRPDSPPHQARDDPGPQYPYVDVPDDWQ